VTTIYDVNEAALQGIEQALRNAAERWEEAGAPCPTEAHRDSIRSFVKQEKLDVGRARETYRYLIHWTEEANFEAARLARNAEMDSIRAQRREKKAAMAAELKEIRESLGLSQHEMNDKLLLKPGVIANAERPNGGYSNDFVESILRRYRVEAKLRAGL
jgi:DNA-binding transcriptional regulator YiaG